MNLAYHDAKYADLYEQTMYNALLGGTDLEGKNFYYTNPLDASMGRGAVAHLPVLRGQHSAHAADDADLDVRQERRTASTSTCSWAAPSRWRTSPAPMSRWCRRPTIRGAARSRITVNPKVPKNFSVRIRVPEPRRQQLYTHAPEGQRPHFARGERPGGEAGDRKGLRRDHARVESGRQNGRWCCR